MTPATTLPPPRQRYVRRAPTALLCLAIGSALLAGCAPQPQPVVDQRPLIADAPDATREAAPSGTTITRFREYTCKSFQPFAANTQWRYQADVTGEPDMIRLLVASYERHGWTLDTPLATGTLSYAGMSKGEADAEFKLSTVTKNLIYVDAYTPCIDQPADRQELVIDPSDPRYSPGEGRPTPTVSP